MDEKVVFHESPEDFDAALEYSEAESQSIEIENLDNDPEYCSLPKNFASKKNVPFRSIKITQIKVALAHPTVVAEGLTKIEKLNQKS